MQLYKPGMHWAIFKVERCSFKNICAEIVPRFRFRKNRISQCPRQITAFLRVANFEDKLHPNRIPEASAALSITLAGVSSTASSALLSQPLWVEINRQRGFNRSGFAADAIGTEAPPSRRVHGRRDQRIGAADGMKVYYRAIG